MLMLFQELTILASSGFPVMPGFLPLTLILLLVFAVLRSQKPTFSKGSTGSVPRSVTSTVPVLGHLVAYVKDGPSYFSRLCLSSNLPVFNIRIATARVTLIQPEFTRFLPKLKHVGLNPLVLDMLRQSLGLGQFSSNLLRERDQQSREFGPHASRMFREEFISNLRLRDYVEKIDGYIRLEVERMSGSAVDLEDWVFNCLVGALGKSIWGSREGPFHDQHFLSHLRSFLLNIRALNNPATYLIDKKLLESRKVVRESLEQFTFEEYSQGRHASHKGSSFKEEDFLDRIRSLCLRHGAPPEGWTDYQLLLISGIGPNIVSASTWTLYHLLDNRDRLEAVRSEINTLADTCQGSIDLADIPVSCPLLHAVWIETLRFHGTFTLGRYVHEDTTLGNTYLLRKGSYALAPLRPHHFDRKLWGEDADQFRPERFLKCGKFDEEERKKLRVFGLFGTICPGRFLAANMAMALTLRLVSTFDLVPLGGKFVLPEERKDSVVGLATPDHNVIVDVKRRKEPGNLDLTWKS